MRSLNTRPSARARVFVLLEDFVLLVLLLFLLPFVIVVLGAPVAGVVWLLAWLLTGSPQP